MGFHPAHAQLGELRRALRSCVGRACAYNLRDGAGAAAAGVLERVIRADRVSDAVMLDALSFGEAPARGQARAAGPAIIPGRTPGQAIGFVSVRGVALYDTEFQPYAFSTRLLAATVTDLAGDPEIGTIVLDMNTPGGAVTGTAEAGDAIFAARSKKPVIALINPLCASAGYWLAAQCSKIIAIPSADVGSIGVFMMHCDLSAALEQSGMRPTFVSAGEFKVEGNSYEPLGEKARAHLQSEVDDIHRQFLAAVSRGRGVSVATVRDNFGRGRTMMAPAAKSVGMVDAIAPADQVLGSFGIVRRTASGRSGPATASTEDLSAALSRSLSKSRRERLDELSQDPNGRI